MEPNDPLPHPAGETRRSFLKKAVAGSAAFAVVGSASASAATSSGKPPRPTPLPWYRRALRWAQTNITEIDPTRYDISWWRQHWQRTQVQGVIINAGGIFAYYPSRFPLHHRAARTCRGRNPA